MGYADLLLYFGISNHNSLLDVKWVHFQHYILNMELMECLDTTYIAISTTTRYKHWRVEDTNGKGKCNRIPTDSSTSRRLTPD